MIDSLMAIAGGAVLFSQNHTLFFISVIIIALYGVIVFAFNKPVKKINEKAASALPVLLAIRLSQGEGLPC